MSIHDDGVEQSHTILASQFNQTSLDNEPFFPLYNIVRYSSVVLKANPFLLRWRVFFQSWSPGFFRRQLFKFLCCRKNFWWGQRQLRTLQLSIDSFMAFRAGPGHEHYKKRKATTSPLNSREPEQWEVAWWTILQKFRLKEVADFQKKTLR